MKFSTLSILALLLHSRVGGAEHCHNDECCAYNGAKSGDGFSTDQTTRTIVCSGENSCGNLEGGIIGRITGCHRVICSGPSSCGMNGAHESDYVISIDEGGTLECRSGSCIVGGPYFVGAGGTVECSGGSCAYSNFVVGEGTKMTCADRQTCFSVGITGYQGASFGLICSGKESCSHSARIVNPGGTITCGPNDGACYGFGGSITGPPAVVTCFGDGQYICGSTDISATCLACVGSGNELCGTYVTESGFSRDPCKFNNGPCPTAGASAGVCTVTDFYLWNADDYVRVVGPYMNNNIADRPTFCRQDWEFSVEADPTTLQQDTDHIEITLSGPITHYRNEYIPPYALFGNHGSGGHDFFHGRGMQVGDYSMRTKVFNDNNQELEDTTFYFSIEECERVVPITPAN